MKKLILTSLFLVLTVSAAFADTTALEKALSLLNDGKTDDAIAILKDQITANPDISDNHLAMGFAKMDKNDLAGAKESFQRAVSLNKKLVAAHYMLAMIYEKEGDSKAAIEKWQNILKYTKDAALKNLATKHIGQLQGEIK